MAQLADGVLTSTRAISAKRKGRQSTPASPPPRGARGSPSSPAQHHRVRVHDYREAACGAPEAAVRRRYRPEAFGHVFRKETVKSGRRTAGRCSPSVPLHHANSGSTLDLRSPAGHVRDDFHRDLIMLPEGFPVL